MDINQILTDHGFGGGTVVKGTAGLGDVLSGKTFMSATGKGLLTGTMPENGGVVITPGPNDIAIPAGHHDGTGKVSKVVVNAAHLLTGDTVAGTAGTMPNQGSVTLTPSGTGTVAIPSGYHDGTGKVAQVNVPAGSVLAGTTIAGIAGTIPVRTTGLQLNPSTTQVNAPNGYYDGAHEPFVPAEPNLIAANILSGKSIFGVAGNVQPRGYASGTASSNSPTTVSGLSFTPTVVVIEYSLSGTLFRKVYRSGGPTDSIEYSTGSSPATYNSGGWTITSGGFSTSMVQPGLTVNWYAWA